MSFFSPQGPEVAEVQVSREAIIRSLRDSPEAFINFFMGDALTFPVPEFHRNIWDFMTHEIVRLIAIGVPRGHAKTTLAKLAVIHYFLFTDVQFIVYLCNTSDLAEKATLDIIEFMQTPNFVKVFGTVVFETEKRGEGEYIFTIRTPYNGLKTCILKARGAGQRMRGINIKNLRPQVAIVDDYEDPDDLKDEKAVIANRRWFFGTFLKAMDRRFGKCIYIGNLVDPNCLLKQLTQMSNWKSVVMGAILPNGQPLWPELWPIEALIEDYQSYANMGLASLWFAEMMNLIILGENGLCGPDDIYYSDPVMPGIEKIRGGFITVDPAAGVGNDDTAVVVHLLLEDNRGNLIPHVVDYEFGQLDELKTCDAIVRFLLKWGLAVVGIESVAYQRALATVLELVLANRSISGIQVLKTYPGSASKLLRIRSFVALLKEKAYTITRNEMHITNQILAFDVTKDNNKDDLLDCCAQGPEMVKAYLPLILSQRRQGTLAMPQPVRQSELC